ncbi:recombinase family protein [Agathobaculum sp.]|uniref:recombinase family protein n=1 Tax=Agathobaculum sp. TaxID=2048138 RepID=UPI002A814D79|nr:recombinase family protein [Agathobaculum sp.]MDY3619010.1 recombinase family protein [Agathobaculum sp.]
MAIPYGFEKMASGNVRMVAPEIGVVQRIYQRYVDGASLGGIAAQLEADKVVAPSSKDKWSRSVIDKILSNGKYVPYAIPMELFVAVQFEKESRSNIQTNNDGSMQRKTTRYSSQNVLSGLLVCAECGSNYRRITKPSSEVVWRCSDRVENGKRSVCKHSPTITDINIKALISEKLALTVFDEETVRRKLSHILVKSNRQIDIAYSRGLALHL